MASLGSRNRKVFCERCLARATFLANNRNCVQVDSCTNQQLHKHGVVNWYLIRVKRGKGFSYLSTEEDKMSKVTPRSVFCGLAFSMPKVLDLAING
jgi:hypothetical protein